MDFYEKIKLLRKKKGISQQELASQIGLHLTNLNRLENGHSQPSFEVLKKLMEIFEVSANYLLDDDDNNFEVKINNKSLAEKIKLIDNLEDDDQRAIIQVIDSMLTKQKIREFVNQPTRELTTN